MTPYEQAVDDLARAIWYTDGCGPPEDFDKKEWYYFAEDCRARARSLINIFPHFMWKYDPESRPIE